MEKEQEGGKEETANTCDTEEEDNQVELVPAQLQVFFQLENDDIIYCIIHSCHFKSVKSSVISHIWMKEYIDVGLRSFGVYLECTDSEPIIGNNPVFRVVELASVHSHCLLIPYQKLSCFYQQIHNPTTWSNEFYIFN